MSVVRLLSVVLRCVAPARQVGAAMGLTSAVESFCGIVAPPVVRAPYLVYMCSCTPSLLYLCTPVLLYYIHPSLSPVVCVPCDLRAERQDAGNESTGALELWGCSRTKGSRKVSGLKQVAMYEENAYTTAGVLCFRYQSRPVADRNVVQMV